MKFRKGRERCGVDESLSTTEDRRSQDDRGRGDLLLFRMGLFRITSDKGKGEERRGSRKGRGEEEKSGEKEEEETAEDPPLSPLRSQSVSLLLLFPFLLLRVLSSTTPDVRRSGMYAACKGEDDDSVGGGNDF